MGQNQSQIIYAVPVGDKKPGESHVYRNPLNVEGLTVKPQENLSTLQDIIEHGKQKYGDQDFVGLYTNKEQTQYKYLTYNQVYEEARELGSALCSQKLYNDVHEYKDFRMKVIGIYSKNRYEWNTTDMACVLYGFTSIPLYDTLGPSSISHVLQNSSISSLFCTQQSAETILKTEELHNLQNLILYDQIDETLKVKIKKKGLNYYDYQELIKMGKQNILPLPEVKPQDIFTFSYTSGTTGLPKATMLTHGNLISQVANVKYTQMDILSTDIQMCYLPLAHIFQRAINILSWYTGMKLANTTGDITKLKHDLQTIRPTIFVSVPRLFNKFYDLIQNQFQQRYRLQKIIIDYALNTKLQNLRKYGSLKHIAYDNLIFNKVQKVFGGRVRWFLSGSAPLSNITEQFFKVVFGVPFFNGYGQTEGSALEYINNILDGDTQQIGVCSGLEFKLIDIPEMNYFSTDQDDQGLNTPRGELCIRGKQIFVAYYKDEEKTKEAIDDEGWLHSGDVAKVFPNGSIKIIDRKKNIFKLSQGEYVAPEKVENVYQGIPEVAEVFLHGDSLQNYCVAVVVPNPESINKIAQELNIQSDDFKELCANQLIVKKFQKIMFEHGKKEGLCTFEQAIKIYLEPVSMTIHGCLTNTMKLQRHQAKIIFKNVLDQLYEQEQ